MQDLQPKNNNCSRQYISFWSLNSDCSRPQSIKSLAAKEGFMRRFAAGLSAQPAKKFTPLKNHQDESIPTPAGKKRAYYQIRSHLLPNQESETWIT